MAWKPEDDSDEWQLGRCVRCDHARPVKVAGPPEFRLDEDGDPYVPLKECTVCGWGGVERSHLKGGYFKRDLLEVVDELPSMGKPCYHCGARIPKFLDLATEDRSRIYNLARSGHEDAAVEDLMTVMGCPREWARLWVTHPLGPRRPARLWIGPPCPQCARPLRTRLARQCFECGKDWHDSENLRKLG
jgi:hypothetical protein